MLVPLVLVIFACSSVFSEQYTSQYNNEIDAVLNSERLMKNYVDCLLGNGKCTPAGEELKRDIPDALQTECAKCSDEHKEGLRKVARYLIEKKPIWWKQLEEKYDPSGSYKKQYQHYLDEEGLQV